MSSSPLPPIRPAQSTVDAALPTRAAAWWLATRRALRICLRGAHNLAAGPARHSRGSRLAAAPVIAEHHSPLWLEGRDDEFILRAGKVHNLRRALRGLEGIEVPAGAVLSFWRQVGWPGRLRGFVEGREIIQGCVVPTPGGGLCQLSNALAEVARQAGLEFVERHRHTARIEQGSLPREDATVAWNHVDLRLRARFAFRVEASLDAGMLRVRLRAASAPRISVDSAAFGGLATPALPDTRRTARGCLTCAETGCFRHRSTPLPRTAQRALLLDEYSPELAAWLDDEPESSTWFVPWQRPARRQAVWPAAPGAHRVVEYLAVWRRMLRQRLVAGEGASRQRMRHVAAHWLARAYARRLQPLQVELLVAQSLLVPLFREGVLGGRAYDVWVNELPAGDLQARLDAAARQDPSASLGDFRVDALWEADEWRALAGARKRVTAHAAIAEALAARGLSCIYLPWRLAPVPPRALRVRAAGECLTLVLPASALPRKGALAVRTAARALGARVLILGAPPDPPQAWDGIEWRAAGYGSDWLGDADAVVLPAHVEHQPRALLMALAAGLPVFASPACGLGALPGWVPVEPGCAASLEAALRAWQASQESERLTGNDGGH